MHHGSGASYKGLLGKVEMGQFLLAAEEKAHWPPPPEPVLVDGRSCGASVAPPPLPAPGGPGCSWVVKLLPAAEPQQQQGCPRGAGGTGLAHGSDGHCTGILCSLPILSRPQPRTGL